MPRESSRGIIIALGQLWSEIIATEDARVLEMWRGSTHRRECATGSLVVLTTLRRGADQLKPSSGVTLEERVHCASSCQLSAVLIHAQALGDPGLMHRHTQKSATI